MTASNRSPRMTKREAARPDVAALAAEEEAEVASLALKARRESTMNTTIASPAMIDSSPLRLRPK